MQNMSKIQEEHQTKWEEQLYRIKKEVLEEQERKRAITEERLSMLEAQGNKRLIIEDRLSLLEAQGSNRTIMEERVSKLEKETMGPLKAELEVQYRVHEKQRLMLLKQNEMIEGLRSSLANLNSNAAAQASQNIAYQQQLANRVCDELSSFKKSLAEIVNSSVGWRRVRSRTS